MNFLNRFASKKSGKYTRQGKLFGLLIVLVLATGGFLGWNYWQNRSAKAFSEQVVKRRNLIYEQGAVQIYACQDIRSWISDDFRGSTSTQGNNHAIRFVVNRGKLPANVGYVGGWGPSQVTAVYAATRKPLPSVQGSVSSYTSTSLVTDRDTKGIGLENAVFTEGRFFMLQLNASSKGSFGVKSNYVVSPGSDFGTDETIDLSLYVPSYGGMFGLGTGSGLTTVVKDLKLTDIRSCSLTEAKTMDPVKLDSETLKKLQSLDPEALKKLRNLQGLPEINL